MDGFAATEAIRATADGRHLPIIALTAHALSGERERCLARGMSDYLAKPFKAHELFAAVEGGAARTAAPAAVDVAAFRAAMRAAGAEAAVEGILDTFLEHAGGHVDELERATTAGDFESIARAAHAFRAAAGAIGAHRLAEALGALEQGAHGTIQQVRDEWQVTRREAEAVVAYLRTARGVQPSHG
jgi:two-component system, sensor histidine kinase and response regulator